MLFQKRFLKKVFEEPAAAGQQAESLDAGFTSFSSLIRGAALSVTRKKNTNDDDGNNDHHDDCDDEYAYEK